ncbi:hypothetical protein SAMN04490248_10377 [Salinihabitans flavidus]|uniref:Uncharacterized protein n=1 Tax=Salinihabitans flavidus TaxID=569882 RepID=A0A1H8NA27_9RHOB|nr:hypothetical protein [Salinihabitans flavidus]SEO26464.1 hypothetical protein SAMN04490248_10377 [Salinihabitans flavidus]
MTVRTVLILSLCAATALGACDRIRKQSEIAFDGEVFRPRSAPLASDNRMSFTVEVRNASRTFEGAREAAEYGGIRYCVTHFGTSRIEWKTGPETDAALLRLENDTLTYEGTCKI